MNIFNQRYTHLTQIGAGGMGTVYRAHDSQTQQIVAIKHLNSAAVDSNPQLLERFKREGEALRQLNHPNIVKMMDSFAEDGEHYLVMEYVEGADLAQVLKQGALPLNKMLNIAIDMADALTRAHRLNIIHRDIKPGNILIAEDGTVRLTDFGIAHIGAKSDITEQNMIIGTLAYLSPEACNGQPLDARTDVWSFGVVLYEMLTGQTPFSGDTVSALIVQILTQTVPDLENTNSSIPIELIDLIYRMLAKDVQMRVPSVRIVGAELEAILQGSAVPQTGALKITQPDLDTVMVSAESQPAENRFATTPNQAKTSQIKHNLPAETSAFVGRSAELTEIKRFLATQRDRLVTIVAPGGMGKTRLAIEYARQNLESYPDGVYLVELAPLVSAESILPTLADTLNIKIVEHAPPLSQILQDMGDKQSLIIMDNFEHIIDGARLIQDILIGTPHVKIIATSREKLNLSSEIVFQLSGMDFPEWETPEDALEYAAVRLFMQSARRILPSFELSADDLTYIARVCRLVQGMPLGILLAASWVEMLTIEEIAHELEASVNFLESEMRDLPERHRSIRAVFEYSWNLIGDNEREVLAALSVFKGGFTREAAQKVTGATLRTLTRLVNKSLLTRDSASGRYNVHELLRQYAYAELQNYGNEETVRQAHAEYYMSLLDYDVDDLIQINPIKMSEFFNAEVENLHLAWEWSVDRHMNDAIMKASTIVLDYFGFALNKYMITNRWYEYARQKWNIYHRDMSSLNRVERRIMVRQPSELNEESLTRLEFAIEAARADNDLSELAFCLMAYGIINSTHMRRYATAIIALEESIEINEQLGYSPAVAMQMLYRAYLVDGDFKLAYKNLTYQIENNKDHFQIWQFKALLGILYVVEMYIHPSRGEAAIPILDEVCNFYERIGNLDDLVATQLFLFEVYLLQENMGEVEKLMNTIRQYVEVETGDRGQAISNETQAFVALYRHDFAAADHFSTASFEIFQGFFMSGAKYVQSICQLHNDNAKLAQMNIRDYVSEWIGSPARLKEGRIVPVTMDIEPADAPLYARALPLIFAELARQQGQLEISAQIIGKYLQTPIDVKYWVEELPIFVELPAKLEDEMGAEAYQAALLTSINVDLSELYTQLIH